MEEIEKSAINNNGSESHLTLKFAETTRLAFLMKVLRYYMMFSFGLFVWIHYYDVDIYLSPIILDEALYSLVKKQNI